MPTLRRNQPAKKPARRDALDFYRLIVQQNDCAKILRPERNPPFIPLWQRGKEEDLPTWQLAGNASFKYLWPVF
jgi:hypothetical protein